MPCVYMICTVELTPSSRRSRNSGEVPGAIDLARARRPFLRAHLRLDEVSSWPGRRNFSGVKHTRRRSGVVSRVRNEKSSRHVLDATGSANNPRGRFAKSELSRGTVAHSVKDRSISLTLSFFLLLSLSLRLTVSRLSFVLENLPET